MQLVVLPFGALPLRQFTRDKVMTKLKLVCLFVCFIFILLSRERATVALYFGRIRTRLGVVHFRVFWLFLRLLTTKFTSYH